MEMASSTISAAIEERNQRLGLGPVESGGRPGLDDMADESGSLWFCGIADSVEGLFGTNDQIVLIDCIGSEDAAWERIASEFCGG